ERSACSLDMGHWERCEPTLGAPEPVCYREFGFRWTCRGRQAVSRGGGAPRGLGMSASDPSAAPATAATPTSLFSASLSEADPEVAEAIRRELGRQRDEIELIASENIVSRAV